MTRITGKLEPNQFVVIIPFLATVIGVTYDVGYFYGIDVSYFTFFSFAEHILFALKGLPYALVFSAIAVTMIVMYDVRINQAKAEMAGSIEGYHLQAKPFLLAGSALALFAAGGLMVYDGLDFFAVSTVFGFLFTLIVGLLPGAFQSLRSVLGYVTFSLLVVTFLGAYGEARRTLSPFGKLDTLILPEGNMDGRIVRSGDRGILFYDLTKNQIALIPWNRIAQVESKKQ